MIWSPIQFGALTKIDFGSAGAKARFLQLKHDRADFNLGFDTHEDVPRIVGHPEEALARFLENALETSLGAHYETLPRSHRRIHHLGAEHLDLGFPRIALGHDGNFELLADRERKAPHIIERRDRILRKT